MIKFDLSNRVAVITGGAQGFGFAIAERFIQSGAKVVIWDIDEQEANKAVEKINSENISYKIVNVCNFEEISKSLKDIETEHNKIDIFVNNAGITGMNKTVAEYPIEEWEKVIQLNLNAVFYCCKAVVPVIIGLILGELVEGTLRQSLVIFDGNWLMFLQRPIALTFFVLSLIALSFPLIKRKKKNDKV